MRKTLLSTVATLSLFMSGAITANAQDAFNLAEGPAAFANGHQTDGAANDFNLRQELFEFSDEEIRLTPKSVDPLYGNLDAFYGNLDAFYGNLDAFYGNLDAFYGNLDAFWGNLDAFWGNLDAFGGSASANWGNLDAFYGNLDAFYGNLDAFYGNLDAFWGNLDAFYGNLDAFNGDLGGYWGNLDAFYGNLDAFYGNLDAFYGNLDAFWGNLDAFWGNLDAFWGNLDAFETSKTDYFQLASDLETFVAMSKEAWEPLIVGLTGKSFEEGFADILLKEHGIDLSDPASLENLSASDRAKFFLDWHDNLMMFSGRDQVDVWMTQINWTPAITQQQGAGSDTVIGLLDFAVAGDADIADNLTVLDGVSHVAGGHGAAVASLMVGAHDGWGVMGIAPNASVVAYNPFDETNTAGWTDIRNGIIGLAENDASLINMSLGVSGHVLHQDWMTEIFTDPDVIAATQNAVFIKAAGNDGIVQTNDINWDFSVDPNLIIVGAIGWDGEIADWSNTPGDACLLDNGACHNGNRLMDRFIVAPGEMILVSDDAGWVHRQSGTSFAAPLVSGAIALLHDRWPWLAQHPEESVEIILQSAKDLGAPGVDEVYGHGLLDVEASQSPLNFDNLEYYQVSTKNNKSKSKALSANKISKKVSPSWESKGVFYYAFEDIGDTLRDFAIPFSSQLIGQTTIINGNEERFQEFIYYRMVDWINGAGFTDSTSETVSLAGLTGWNMAMTATSYAPGHEVRDGELPFQTSMVMRNPDAGMTLKIGHGEGAMALTAGSGFGLASDFDSETGGVNPLLGLASGGAYAGGAYNLSDRATLNFGLTGTDKAREYQDPITGEYRDMFEGLANYAATAANVNLAYDLNSRITLNAGYTMLQEDTGLLGVQGLDPINLEGGAVTDAATFGADLALPFQMDLSASATLGQTRTGSFGDGELRLEDQAQSSAWQMALGKQAILGDADKVRLSFAQPLHIERGTMAFDSVQVVDRQTGELGVVTQVFEMDSGKRPFVAEGIYAAPVFEGFGEFSAFARAELNMERDDFATEETDYSIGARIAFKY